MGAPSLEQQAAAELGVGQDGAELLNEVEGFIRRFCVLPTRHDLVAATLWAAHTHAVEHFHTTPRLALLSPEPGSGKTRVLEVLDLLTPAPMFVFAASVAAIFRTMGEQQTTLLFDEVDAIFGRRGKDDGNEDLRALLNVGYRHGATIPRCVGKDHEVQHFNVFAAVALAGLGDLPDTIMTRAVVVKMRRRAPNEAVEQFRLRQHEPQGHAIRDRLAAWAGEHGPDMGRAWPVMPPGIVDRPAECWEPLLAVADAAGGDWPARAREACVAINAATAARGQSLGVRLLIDLRKLFDASGAVAMPTADILVRLCGEAPYARDEDDEGVFLTEAPWRDLRGSPLDERGLANLLRRYDARPVKIKVAGRSLQGYRREDLWDAWQRYAPTPQEAEPAEPAEPTGQESGKGSGGSIGSGLAEGGESAGADEQATLARIKARFAGGAA